MEALDRKNIFTIAPNFFSSLNVVLVQDGTKELRLKDAVQPIVPTNLDT